MLRRQQGVNHRPQHTSDRRHTAVLRVDRSLVLQVQPNRWMPLPVAALLLRGQKLVSCLAADLLLGRPGADGFAELVLSKRRPRRSK
jgi:hypothetical protein